jgi:hypothetical protein
LFREITELLPYRWQQNWICIHLEKLSYVSFTNPTSTVGLQLLNLWLLNVMLRCINNNVTTIKPGHRTTGNAHVIWSDESCSRCSIHQEDFAFGEHLRKPIIQNSCFQQWHMGEVLWWFGQQYCGILLVPLLRFMTELLQGSLVHGQLG